MIIQEVHKLENILKETYLNHSYLNLNLPLTYNELISKCASVNLDLSNFSHISIDCDLIENKYFTDNNDIALIQHIRYLPAIIHSHNFFEIIYVHNGDCINYISKTKLEMIAGDVCIIAPHTSHSISAFSDDVVIYNFLIRTNTFDFSFLSLLSENDILSTFFTKAIYGNPKHPYLLFRTDNDPNLYEFVQYAFIEYNSDNKYKNRMLNNLLSAFFILLLRKHENSVIVSSSQSIQDENLILILKYIQNNYKTLTLSKLAKSFNYSERHISRLIKEYTGSTFSDIIRELKVKKAAELLHNPDITISEIISIVGYSDLSSFYRAFKKYYDLTPIEYRQNLMNPFNVNN